jgi:hypothetical protein
MKKEINWQNRKPKREGKILLQVVAIDFYSPRKGFKFNFNFPGAFLAF